MNGTNGTGDTFTTGTVGRVVTPYRTDTPAEAGLREGRFGERIDEIRQETNDQGRVLRATEDSKAVRPEADIDGQGALFDDANWAHENADAVAGKYFTAEEGQCETPSLPVSDPMDRFCESFPATANRSCDIVRKIRVDRTDHYRCDTRPATFVKICEKEVNWQCDTSGTKGSCIRDNIRIAGTGVDSVSWNGRTATVTFRAVSPHPRPVDSGALVRHRFTIRVADRFLPSSVILRRGKARGVLQVTSENDVLATFANTQASGFGAGGPGCPATPTAGWLVPVTKADGCWVAGANPEAWAAVTARPLTASSNNLESALTGPDYRSGWDVPQGLAGTIVHRTKTYRVCEDPGCGISREECGPAGHTGCHMYAALDANAYVNRSSIRQMNIASYLRADPESGKRWKSSTFFARVVYRTGQSGGGWAQLAIEFDGACCNRFNDIGRELCQ